MATAFFLAACASASPDGEGLPPPRPGPGAEAPGTADETPPFPVEGDPVSGFPVRGDSASPPPSDPDTASSWGIDGDTASLSLQDYRELCRSPGQEELLEEVSRAIQETSCGAVLWVDGLFGSERDVAGARRTSGAVELSGLYSQFGGFEPGGRLRLRYDLPNLERRVNMFLGRGDDREAVEDREERFSIRSSLPGLEATERWIAGLGLSLPGRWEENADARVGVRPSTSPSLFVQGRLRQAIPVGEWAEWRFRQTLFWDSGDGFGITARTVYQHFLSPLVLLDLSALGTLSEGSEGVEWRAEPSLFRRMGSAGIVGLRPFARGATSAEVPMREYGIRVSYQRPLGPSSLVGELVVGYSWPRELSTQAREGSASVALRLELGFGRR